MPRINNEELQQVVAVLIAGRMSSQPGIGPTGYQPAMVEEFYDLAQRIVDVGMARDKAAEAAARAYQEAEAKRAQEEDAARLAKKVEERKAAAAKKKADEEALATEKALAEVRAEEEKALAAIKAEEAAAQADLQAAMKKDMEDVVKTDPAALQLLKDTTTP